MLFSTFKRFIDRLHLVTQRQRLLFSSVIDFILRNMQNISRFFVAPDGQHLGRLDPSLLPEQSLMEIFVDGFQNKTMFQDEHGNYTDCHTWDSLKIYNGVITQVAINDNDNPLEGSMNMRFLPSSVTLLRLVRQKLGGQLDTAQIPWSLISLELWDNALDGSFKTQGLPQSIVKVNIERNKFSGSLHLDALPRGMQKFVACRNALSGSLNFTELPQTLLHLDLEQNPFSGVADLSSLPDSLTVLLISSNELCGSIDTKRLPRGLHDFYVDSNAFSGEIDFKGIPDDIRKFRAWQNTLGGTFHARHLPWGIERLVLCGNAISGEMHTAALAQSLQQLDVGTNHLTGEVDFTRLPRKLFFSVLQVIFSMEPQIYKILQRHSRISISMRITFLVVSLSSISRKRSVGWFSTTTTFPGVYVSQNFQGHSRACLRGTTNFLGRLICHGCRRK